MVRIISIATPNFQIIMSTHQLSNSDAIEMRVSPQDFERIRQYYYAREAKRRNAREMERLHWLQRAREAIGQIAPRYADIRRVFLFGSVTQAHCFRPDSDIDVAVECDSPVSESAFWRELERCLRRDVDVRPLVEPLAMIVLREGEQVYGHP